MKPVPKRRRLRLRWNIDDAAKCGLCELVVDSTGSDYVFGVDAFGSIWWSDEGRHGKFKTELDAKFAAESWLLAQLAKMRGALRGSK